MVSEKDFSNICSAGIEIFPMLKDALKDEDAETFFSNLPEVKRVYKIIVNKFDDYKLYPRENMDKMPENIEYLIDCCKKTDLKINFSIDVKNNKFDEGNWSVFRHINPFCRIYYKSIEITKLLDL